MKRDNALATALLALAALIVVAPLYMLLTGVMMGEQEVMELIGPALTGATGMAGWRMLPQWPTLRPLAELLLDTPNFFAMFWNACLITFPAVAGQVLVAAPAAWALSKYRFKGESALNLMYMALMLMPFQVLMAPSYLALDRMRLLDTRWAVILPAVFSAFPVFLLTRLFEGVPQGFLEAAQLDGAGTLRVFWHIGLPLGMPGVLSVVVLGFLEQWNAIEQPIAFFRDRSLWPLSLMLSSITAERAGAAFSASLITMLPAALIFLWGQPYLEDGIRAAGLKE